MYTEYYDPKTGEHYTVVDAPDEDADAAVRHTQHVGVAPTWVPARTGRDAVQLPAAPSALAPIDAAFVQAALAPVQITRSEQDNAMLRARASMLRTTLAALLSVSSMALLWLAAWLRWSVAPEWLILATVAALALTVTYYVYAERLDYRHTSTGIAHAQIGAAERMHARTLDHREQVVRIHAEAWREVAAKALESLDD